MSGTYRAIRLEHFAESFRQACVMADLPLSAPQAGEVRVRNLYCGINGIFDTQLARDAVDYVKIAIPTLTGVEALGVVDAVGAGVTELAVGDAVVTTRFTGGYREANIAPAANFIKVPSAAPEWLALASTGVSAMVALDVVGQLQPGETIAISAAAGGLGHFLVQIAVARGCHVVAVCGGPDKAAFVRSLGAARVIDYKCENVGEVLAAEYHNALNVAVDTVGGRIFDAFLANLANHGRLVVSGAASDNTGQPELVTAPRISHAIYYKGASVRSFMNGLLGEHWPAAREKLFGLYTAGVVKVHFDTPRYTGLEGVYDAVERLLSGASMGKIIVDVRSA
jgi:NADPH-dependent curcumin reductase CurA